MGKGILQREALVPVCDRPKGDVSNRHCLILLSLRCVLRLRLEIEINK